MSNTLKIDFINVIIEFLDGEKVYIATSIEFPGLFIAHKDRDKVVQDIPVTIKAIYKAQYGLNVEVILSNMLRDENRPSYTVKRHD